MRVPPPNWRERADRVLERGRKVDRFLPFLDTPLTHLGYGWATALGWAWGSLWSTGRVERRNGLWVFTGMPEWAFGRGGVCVGGCFLTGDARVTDAVLSHEAVHAQQWRRYGFLMPILYLLAGRNPLTNRFEIEAGLEAGNYVPRDHPHR